MMALAVCRWFVTPSEPHRRPTKLTTKASGEGLCSAEMLDASLSPITGNSARAEWMMCCSAWGLSRNTSPTTVTKSSKSGKTARKP